MKAEELAVIKERAAEATGGPWNWLSESVLDGDDEVITEFGDDISDKNAQFIAHAREDIPKLVAEIECTRTEISDAIGYLFECYGHGEQDDFKITTAVSILRRALRGGNE